MDRIAYHGLVRSNHDGKIYSWRLNIRLFNIEGSEITWISHGSIHRKKKLRTECMKRSMIRLWIDETQSFNLPVGNAEFQFLFLFINRRLSSYISTLKMFDRRIRSEVKKPLIVGYNTIWAFMKHFHRRGHAFSAWQKTEKMVFYVTLWRTWALQSRTILQVWIRIKKRDRFTKH